ncbi:carboxypeptidase regulatory-like domain-containing protein [Candidatus Gottesmanbacteria bacterium]|nr:carboxypeptidase regulatory-like domain-containing protein [Candidatus Gottesmanbacteria bacterium]
MKKIILIFPIFLSLFFLLPSPILSQQHVPWWDVQSIDTMKYSRDLAREKLKNASFDQIIDQQVKNIAQTGSTHIAIATPYDDEFLPYLTRWVKAARKYNLKVWLRGNFSGWEKWFDYRQIGRTEHTAKTKEFILQNKDLFEDGDIFTSCPECENGGPGDPRITGDVLGYRKFLISEYTTIKDVFRQIRKDVRANLYSMNGDVARLIMDKETTSRLDGVVTIDHYVATPEELLQDIENIVKSSGGKVFLGEIGAPIPDIHGNMTEDQQANYIANTLSKLAHTDSLIGLNYWVNEGGSTQLWENNQPRQAVPVIRTYFLPETLSGIIKNDINQPIAEATIETKYKMTKSDNDGRFQLPILPEESQIAILAEGYQKKEVEFASAEAKLTIVLQSEHENILFRFLKFIRNAIRR